MDKQFSMALFFQWLLGRVRSFTAASTSLLRQSFWLLLFFLGWASAAHAAIPASERAVLTDLYASTNGASWTNKTNWNGAVGTECDWYGVMCDATQSHVTGIGLDTNNLVGTLPSLSGLTALQSFQVSHNQLTGSIPSLSGLTSLVWFWAIGNQLTGSIPSLSGLSSLNSFHAFDNQLTGSIPSLSGLTALQNFTAQRNQLTGSIPSLSGLTALQSFYVNQNQLTGSIPSLSGLTALRDFHVNINQLTGTIPSLSGLTALWVFDVSGNKLSGPIPSINGLTALQSFGVGTNQLTGSIPSLSELTALQSFTANNNQLTGSIPSLSGLTALQTFGAFNNQLSGSIPSLSGLTALQTFSVHHNQLTGSIPSLNGLTALQKLRVSNNQLTGPVPAAPTSLTAGASLSSDLCSNSLVSSGDSAIDAAWAAAQDPTVVAGGNWLACQTAVTPSTFLLTVTNAGSGAVTSSPAGINCGATCSGSFSKDTKVTLTANPVSGSTFAGWGGDCSGAGSCVVTMNAAKNVTATFKPKPFSTDTTFIYAPELSPPPPLMLTTTITFNTPDVGKQGAVYVTAWVPANGLSTFGILTAGLSKSMSVTTTSDNPYLAGEVDSRQETLATLLAAADPNAFVLIQLTTSGWQLVQNGQLIPYASGVLGDQLASQNILNNANPANLLGAQFCVGYGTSAAEMITAGRMLPVAAIPDSSSTTTSNGSCNVTLAPYMGLWWNSNESGWGMSLTQHGSTVVNAMYTYDGTGQPTWYTMACTLAGTSCTGDIYKTSGGTPPTAPWNGSGKVTSSAGSGTLTFADANTGTFTYTLNNLPGSKSITRFVFATGSAPSVDYTDLWWNPDESGWGVALTQQYGMVSASWYSYDATGKAVWYVGTCTVSGSGCTTTDLYQVTGGSPPTSAWHGTNAPAKAGTISFAFTDANNGTMSYTINGVPGSSSIKRLAF